MESEIEHERGDCGGGGGGDVDARRGETFCFSRPMTAEEMKHAEDLYLSAEFNRTRTPSSHSSDAGTVLKRGMTLGDPTRAEVESLLRAQMEEDKTPGDPPRTLSDRRGLPHLPRRHVPDRSQAGGATRETGATSPRDETQGMDFLKTIWPKPPAAAKGSKKPPQPYYAEDCGFPSREEVEWALLGTAQRARRASR